MAETKGGVFVYDGAPTRFYEWEFRINIRMRAAKDEDIKKTMSQVVDSLRGEAAMIAMDVGLTDLMKPSGLEELVEAMKKHVVPQARAEAKEFYRVGHKTGGILSRQSGESVMNFVSRRRRWWKMLKSMDRTIGLSSEIRGDLMLESSGLTADQQLMVLTSISNDRDFDKLADALMEQRPKIHVNDRQSRRNDGKHPPKRDVGYKGKG